MGIGVRWVEYDFDRLRCDHSRYSFALDLGIGHSYLNEVSGIHLDSVEAKPPLPANGKELVRQVFSFDECDIITHCDATVVVKKCLQIGMAFMNPELDRLLSRLFTTIENERIVNDPATHNLRAGGGEDYSVFKVATDGMTFFCPLDAVHYHKGGISRKFLEKQLGSPSPLPWLRDPIAEAQSLAAKQGASVSIISAITRGFGLQKMLDSKAMLLQVYPQRGRQVITVHPGGQVDPYQPCVKNQTLGLKS